MEDPLDAVRSLMSAHSPPLDALIVPSEDAHQSEYVAARDKRREFISGFTGSAGLALVTMTEALLWTDGRYFLQASQQLSDRWKLMKMGEDPLVQIWLADNLEKGATVGVDPWCVSVETAQKWEFHFGKSGLILVQLSTNLVDEIWKSRPLPEIHPVVAQPLKFSGRRVEEKLSYLREKLAQEQASSIVVTALDEVAWLYNIRGSDVSYNPVVHAFAIVTHSSAFLYVDKRKVTAEMLRYFGENGIQVRNYGDVVSDLASLESGQLIRASDCNHEVQEHEEHKNTLIWMDPVSCCYALYSNISSNHTLLQQSPLALAKALKNPVELDGLRNAHVRDGAAVVQYLMWLDSKMQEIYGAPGYFSELKDGKRRNSLDAAKLTEVSVSDALESFRAKQELFKGLSFPTISSVGPNAAIIHYSPEEGTCMEMDPDSIYLVDSGAQYQDGTTDITRTVHFGKPSEHEKTSYTAVLKGHIALDTAVFPNGTTGHALDILARIPLWKEGLDYRHGTGHGIGSYLNVHEGPHLISFSLHARNVPLQASMTVTDEPGYYEDGSFGIRLENVLVVKDAKTEYNFGEKGYLSFEHITWVPYQKKMIDLSMLTPQEMGWVDSYHSKCQEILAPYLNESEMAWLKKASEPLRCGA